MGGGGVPFPGDGHRLVEEPPPGDLLHRVTVSTRVAITVQRDPANRCRVPDRETIVRFDIRRRTGVEMRLDMVTVPAPAREFTVR
ncbi:hypothetical protein Van01_28920 [Micromonospora andamanensis]|uniref:Uncharacterized protein n=1 Tax=Micromonospora andamanensis TaxID=1287068 RepID=A0ABQ4HVM4_9ACTN|nr:hypothetical protein Van01_28920 [Micromonospora andamanensis]